MKPTRAIINQHQCLGSHQAVALLGICWWGWSLPSAMLATMETNPWHAGNHGVPVPCNAEHPWFSGCCRRRMVISSLVGDSPLLSWVKAGRCFPVIFAIWNILNLNHNTHTHTHTDSLDILYVYRIQVYVHVRCMCYLCLCNYMYMHRCIYSISIPAQTPFLHNETSFNTHYTHHFRGWWEKLPTAICTIYTSTWGQKHKRFQKSVLSRMTDEADVICRTTVLKPFIQRLAWLFGVDVF